MCTNPSSPTRAAHSRRRTEQSKLHDLSQWRLQHGRAGCVRYPSNITGTGLLASEKQSRHYAYDVRIMDAAGTHVFHNDIVGEIRVPLPSFLLGLIPDHRSRGNSATISPWCQRGYFFGNPFSVLLPACMYAFRRLLLHV